MKHYEGVGRFWRAWFYWDKVKTFGDVPWYDEPIDPDDDEQLYKGRDPRDYVMQKVLEDLDFAATWCSKASKYVNTNVINRYVALALKSRICLYREPGGSTTGWTAARNGSARASPPRRS